jgi:ActR/RegA family two-component response regulator
LAVVTRHDGAAERPPEPVDRPRDVLVLSDDAAFRTALAVRLGAAGLRVEEASAVRHALAEAATWHAFRRDPEALYAVILDIARHPDEGFAVLDAVRRRDCSLPVLVLARCLSGPLPRDRRGVCEVIQGRPDVKDATAAVLRLVAQRERALEHG